MWSKWKRTSDLKFDTHPCGPVMEKVLYQKWSRKRQQDQPPWKTLTQHQWRPVKGQTGAHGILKGDEETSDSISTSGV